MTASETGAPAPTKRKGDFTMTRRIRLLAVILAMLFALNTTTALAAPSDPPGAAQHTITVTAEHGTPSAGNPLSAAAGESVSFIGVTADDGYVYQSSTVTGLAATDESDYLYVSAYPDFAMSIDEMPDSDVTVHVVFVEGVTLTFDANGGTTGSLWRDTQMYEKGSTVTFAIFEDLISPPEGKEYDGVTVNTVRRGPTDEVTLSEDATVVYQWKNPGEDTAPKCAIHFVLNGGTAGPRWEGDIEVGNGAGMAYLVRNDYDVTPPAGKIFAGLTVGNTLYAPGQSIPVAGVEEISPVFTWEDDPSLTYVTATFDPNGGTPGPDWTPSVTVPAGINMPVPEADDLGLDITPPQGQDFAGMEYNGQPYAPGDSFPVPADDFTVKLRWADVSYTFTRGANGTWTKGSAAAFRVTVKRSVNDAVTFQRFAGLAIDGEDVDGDSFTAVPGSVALHLSPSLLETLSTGRHTMTVRFTDGQATATFTVAAAQYYPGNETGGPNNGGAPATAPGTGDRAGLTLWALLGAASLAGAAALVTCRPRRRG